MRLTQDIANIVLLSVDRGLVVAAERAWRRRREPAADARHGGKHASGRMASAVQW
ncbi:MAG: hypothetical protein KY443_00990 [Actinobacteria bacterium]|nr:hypothetical protein [Actinomycetota bacterium]